MRFIMDAVGRVTLCEDWTFHRCLRSPFVLVESPLSSLPDPLTVDEVVELLRSRWQASYDLQLVTRRRRMYLQVMWAYLEQQSFPLSAKRPTDLTSPKCWKSSTDWGRRGSFAIG